MNAMKAVETWTNEITGQEELTKKMREAVARLVDQYFRDPDSYAVEKFIKSFCEPIYSAHKAYKRSYNVDTDSIKKRRLENDAALDRLDKAKRKTEGYIIRQEHHFRIFLKEVHRP